MSRTWRIGELAAATGVTVRTLHHYDELGLVRPHERTGAGHRIYAAADVERLYRVLALRRLGLRLDAIAAVLDRPGGLRETVRAHRAHVERSLELHRRLLDRLDRLLEQPEDTLTDTIEVMTMIEGSFTPDQLATLEERAAALGDEGMASAQRDWATLYAEARELRAAGVDPADPRAQALVDRSEALISRFTGGDAPTRAALDRMYAEQGPERASRGMADPDVAEFLGRARAARG